MLQFVLDACVSREAGSQHLLRVYAACVASLHHTVGVEASAHFVQALAQQYDDHYQRILDTERSGGGASADVGDKQCANLAAMLGYL